jgi:hypothetical protein
MELQRIEREGMEWTDLAQDRDKWRVVVSSVTGDIKMPANYYCIVEKLLHFHNGPCSMEFVTANI